MVSDPRRPVLLELAVANALASQVFELELVRAGYPFTHVGTLKLIEIHGPITPKDLEAETGIAKTTRVEEGPTRSVPFGGYPGGQIRGQTSCASMAIKAEPSF